MQKFRLHYCVSILLCLISGIVFANDYVGPEHDSVKERRAKFNYQMFCQGCHAPDGIGRKSVPTLRNSMSQFMRSQLGREYLVRVPGSANSPLSNEELADVLNWMLREFSPNDTDWRPYLAKEVGQYRKQPLFETVEYRKKILKQLATQ